MRSYGLDLRERVVPAVLRGSSHRVVAQQFSISLATVGPVGYCGASARLGFHAQKKSVVAQARRLVEEAACRWVFLAPYSLDLQWRLEPP